MSDWVQDQQLVLNTLERLTKQCEAQSRCIQNIKIEQAKLQIKSGIWGIIGGAIPVAILLAWYLVQQGPTG